MTDGASESKDNTTRVPPLTEPLVGSTEVTRLAPRVAGRIDASAAIRPVT